MQAFLKSVQRHGAVLRLELGEIIKIPDDAGNIELYCQTTVVLLCAITQIKSRSLWSRSAQRPSENKHVGRDPESFYLQKIQQISPYHLNTAHMRVQAPSM